MKSFSRLYTAFFINSFGSWLTFIAIALICQERYGSSYVAIVFLIQTLPPIFLSRGLVALVPEKRHGSIFALTQILLAANSLLLVFNQSLPAIYVHLFLGSGLRALAGPLFNSLAGRWVEPAAQKRVFTRLGAIQASTLALAPVAGAWIKVVFSAPILFALDAMSFVVAVGLMTELFDRQALAQMSTDRPARRLWAEWIPRPHQLNPSTRRALRCWFIFLAIGAILNSIEFPGFERSRLTEAQIGQALAAWGLGNLLIFLVPVKLRTSWAAVLYVSTLALFAFGPGPMGVLAVFAIAGALNADLGGSLRTAIQTGLPPDENASPTWAYANQITQLINLAAFTAAGLWLNSARFPIFAGAMVVAGGMLVGGLRSPPLKLTFARKCERR